MPTLTKSGAAPACEAEAGEKPLEIIVPFTGADLTQSALDQVDKLLGQLNSRIRVVAVHTVPQALPLERPDISADYLEHEIGKLHCGAPTRGEIYLVRDPGRTWKDLLRLPSLIVIASRRRPWRTAQEKLARLLLRNGHEVVLIYPRKKACSI